AIGLAAGVGNPMAGAIATVVLPVSLVILRPLREFIRRQWATRSMMVEVHLVPGTGPGPLLQDAGELGLEMPDLMIGKERGHVVMRTTVVGHPDTISRWMARLAGSDTV